MIRVSSDYTTKFIEKHEIEEMRDFAKLAHQKVLNKTGSGRTFLGWVDLPTSYDRDEFERVKDAAAKIQKNSEVLVVIGIGGSYLGSKAVIEMLSGSFSNDLNPTTEIYFAGQNMSSEYLTDLAEVISDRDFSINVISKSGTTTEPAIAFRYFKKLLNEKYGTEEANARIYATTDANKGALHDQALENGWTTFSVPDAVGGRFSVLTPVGLLPIAAAGIDIEKLMAGAKVAQNNYAVSDITANDTLLYAILRNILYNKGKIIEMLVGYEDKLQYFNEWWKQLFGESEGKDYKGIFPTSAIFSTDLHSLGQYVQQGRRDLFETVISIQKVKRDLVIEKEADDQDGLNYLAGKDVSYVNQRAMEATLEAHVEGGVSNIVIEVDSISESTVGELIYFFEMSCAVSGYILGVNPFDQPGVEAYKNKMFKLLEKPGY